MGFEVTLTPAQKPMAEHIKKAWQHNWKIINSELLLLFRREKELKAIKVKNNKEKKELCEVQLEIGEVEKKLYSFLMLDQTTSTGKSFLIAHAHHPDCLALDRETKVVVLQSKREQRNKFREEAEKDPDHESPIILESRMDQEKKFCESLGSDTEGDRIRGMLCEILSNPRCMVSEPPESMKNPESFRPYYFFSRNRDLHTIEQAKQFIRNHLERVEKENRRNISEEKKEKENSDAREEARYSTGAFSQLYRWLNKAGQNDVDITPVYQWFPDFQALDKNMIICTFQKACMASLLACERVNLWEQEAEDLMDILGPYLLYVDEAEDFIDNVDRNLIERAPVISLQEEVLALLDVTEPNAQYIDDGLRYFYKIKADESIPDAVAQKAERFRNAAVALRERADTFTRSNILYPDYGVEQSESGLPIYLKASDCQECIDNLDQKKEFILKRTHEGTFIQTRPVSDQKDTEAAEQDKNVITISDYVSMIQEAIDGVVQLIFAAASNAYMTWEKDKDYQDIVESALKRFHICTEVNEARFKYYMSRLTRPYTKKKVRGSDFYLKGISVILFHPEFDPDLPYNFDIRTIHVPYEANAILGAMAARAGLTILGSATGRLPGIFSISAPFIESFSRRKEYRIPDKALNEIHQATISAKEALYGSHQVHAQLIPDLLQPGDEKHDDQIVAAIRNVVQQIERKKKECGRTEGTLTLIYTSKKQDLAELKARNLFSDLSDTASFFQYDRSGVRRLGDDGKSMVRVQEDVLRTEGDKYVLTLEKGKSYYIFCSYRSGERGINIVGEVDNGGEKVFCSVSNIVAFDVSNIVARRKDEELSIEKYARMYIGTFLNGALQSRHYLEYSSEYTKGSNYYLKEKQIRSLGSWAKSICSTPVGEHKEGTVPSDLYENKEFSPLRASALAVLIQTIGRIRTSDDIQVRGDIDLYLDAMIVKRGRLPYEELKRLRPSFEIVRGILNHCDDLMDEYSDIVEKINGKDQKSGASRKRNSTYCDKVHDFTKEMRTALLNDLTKHQHGSRTFEAQADKLRRKMARFEEMKENALNFECQKGTVPLKADEEMYLSGKIIPFQWSDSMAFGITLHGEEVHRPRSTDPNTRNIPQLLEAIYDLDPKIYADLFRHVPIHTARKMRTEKKYPYVPYGITVDIVTGEVGERAFEAMFTWARESTGSRLEIVRSSEMKIQDIPVLYEDFDYFVFVEGKLVGVIDVKNRKTDIDPSHDQEEAQSMRGKIRRFHHWYPDVPALKILYVNMDPSKHVNITKVSKWETPETKPCIPTELQLVGPLTQKAVDHRGTEEGTAEMQDLSRRLVHDMEAFFLEEGDRR